MPSSSRPTSPHRGSTRPSGVKQTLITIGRRRTVPTRQCHTALPASSPVVTFLTTRRLLRHGAFRLVHRPPGPDRPASQPAVRLAAPARRSGPAVLRARHLDLPVAAAGGRRPTAQGSARAAVRGGHGVPGRHAKGRLLSTLWQASWRPSALLRGHQSSKAQQPNNVTIA